MKGRVWGRGRGPGDVQLMDPNDTGGLDSYDFCAAMRKLVNLSASFGC